VQFITTQTLRQTAGDYFFSKVIHSGPEGSALGYPWKRIVCNQAFVGILEYWSLGVLKKQRTKTTETCYDLGKMLFFLIIC